MTNALTVQTNPAGNTAMYVVGALVAAAAGYGLYRAWTAKTEAAPAPLTAEQRARQIVDGSPHLSNDQLTTQLYKQLWPACPDVIDPSNPDHFECGENWLGARVLIEEARVA